MLPGEPLLYLPVDKLQLLLKVGCADLEKPFSAINDLPELPLPLRR